MKREQFIELLPRIMESYLRNRYVSTLFQSILSLTNWGAEVTATWFEELVGCNKAQAIAAFKEVSKTGVLKFVAGRRGYRSRLEWRGLEWRIGYFPEGDEWMTSIGAIEEITKQFDLLADQATSGDRIAQKKLLKMANVAGISTEGHAWEELARSLAPVRYQTGPQKALWDNGNPIEEGYGGDATMDSDQLPPLGENAANNRIKILISANGVVVSLPRDLTEDEAAKFGGVVRNLCPAPRAGKSAAGPPKKPRASILKELYDAGGSGWDDIDDPEKYLEEVTGK